MVFNHNNYRSVLIDWRAQRAKKYGGYSLRAMARFLNMNPSYLSQVFKHEKNLSTEKARQIAHRLNFSERETHYFCELVRAERARCPLEQEAAWKQAAIYRGHAPVMPLALDEFRLISDWYHIAILEMTQMNELSFNAGTIARKLNISEAEIQLAIDRLSRRGLIEKDKNGHYQKTYGQGLFSTPYKDLGLRHFHTQMLNKAVESLKEPNDTKYIGTETLAIDREELNEAKEMIREFKARFVKRFGASKKRTDVFHLIVSFFNLTSHQGKGGPK